MSVFTLLRWLGPWTDQNRAPKGIPRQTITVKEENFDLWVYSPREVRGAIYIVPGLHHEGPADPRLDRFARVLAQAGLIVGVPFLPTSLGLVMKPNLCAEAKSGFIRFVEHIDRPSGVFGISAASIGALAIGSDPKLHNHIVGVMLFGGFFDWRDALLYASKGRGSLAIDPLNLPVIFLNLYPFMPIEIHHEESLLDAWREFVLQTWEKPHMQPRSVHEPIAKKMSTQVHPKDVDVFLMGTSVLEGGVVLVEKALANYTEPTDWLNPVPHMQKLQQPLYLTHGRDDVVVPYQHVYELRKYAPKGTPAYITGFYDHTGITSLWRMLLLLPRIPLELWHSIQLLRKMITVSRKKS